MLGPPISSLVNNPQLAQYTEAEIDFASQFVTAYKLDMAHFAQY
jgi:hypothetical protein